MLKHIHRRKERALIFILLITLSTLVIFFGGYILNIEREYENFKARENRMEAKLSQAHREFLQKEAYLARLANDPDFLERIARERLGYTRVDELIFRFSKNP